MLVDIHLKLQTLKENILPFGGLNIIFMVGFLQFPLVNDCPLCFNNIKLVLSFTKQTLEEVIGKKSMGKLCVFQQNNIAKANEAS